MISISATFSSLGSALVRGFSKAVDAIKDKFFKKAKEPMSVNVGIINNPQVAKYAAYLEYGWVQTVTGKQAKWFRAQLGDDAPKRGSVLIMPPRPIFAATKRACGDKWANYVKTAISTSNGRVDTEKLLAAVGTIAAGDIRNTIAHNGTADERFADRAPLTLALLSKQAEGHRTDGSGSLSRSQALVRSHALINSIHYQIVKGVPEAGKQPGIINISAD